MEGKKGLYEKPVKERVLQDYFQNDSLFSLRHAIIKLKYWFLDLDGGAGREVEGAGRDHGVTSVGGRV